MKKLISLIAILVLIIHSNPLSFAYSGLNNKDVTIEITDNVMICKSKLEHNNEQWTVKHVKQVKQGLNSFYFVPYNGMSVRIEIIKY